MRFSKQQLRDGFGMIRLGLAFVLAAAIGSGAEMAIRAFLNVEGGMEDVGFYNAAFMITITYAGMVFSAMETDYFPRLSAVNKDIEATNETVNKQTEVSLLFLSPMLVGLLMMLPVLIPMLFSSDFLPVVAMAQVAVLAMYFKVLTMPVAYITLARSRSLSYLFLETVYFVVLAIAVVVGYRSWGIWGTGLAIVVAHVVEYVTVNVYAYWQYSFRSTWRVGGYALVQMTIGALAYAVSLCMDSWAYWITEAALTLVSTAYSVHLLHQKTHLWESLKRKFMKSA
jgi:O-antigen/teichoic acid export membrane protein